MKKHGKKYRAALEKLEAGRKYNLEEAVAKLKEIASANDVTPAQVALAWVLRQGNDIVAIPGTKHVRYLEENARAADLKLPEPVWSALDQALSSFQTAGLRYPEATMKFIDTTD